MATKTVDEFIKSGERATMEDALILFECRPRKVQLVKYVEFVEFEQVERKEFEPWDGKREPEFETVQPWNGKTEK